MFLNKLMVLYIFKNILISGIYLILLIYRRISGLGLLI